MSTSKLIAPGRLEELLGGAVPDTHAEARLEGLALALRSGAPAASDELRRRVLGLRAARPGRRVLGSRRRLALVLAPLVLAIVVGSAVLARVGFGSSDSEALRSVPAGLSRNLSGTPIHATRPQLVPPIAHAPYPGARARHVDMWIELRVRDADRLSTAANDTMRITHELGGFVASSTVGTRGDEGRAEISIRLPVGKVDDALLRLSQLGVITSQRVVTEDRQAEIDQASRRIETLRRAIQIAQLRFGSGTLSAKERLDLAIRLERLRGELGSVRGSRARLVRDAATAELTLVLHTQATASKGKQRGVDGVVRDALHVLGRAGAVGLFAAIVLSPLVVLALLAWLLRLRRLRLQEAQLLDRSRPGAASTQPPG